MKSYAVFLFAVMRIVVVLTSCLLIFSGIFSILENPDMTGRFPDSICVRAATIVVTHNCYLPCDCCKEDCVELYA
jgi:type III secretory pathway component EscR